MICIRLPETGLVIEITHDPRTHITSVAEYRRVATTECSTPSQLHAVVERLGLPNEVAHALLVAHGKAPKAAQS